MFVVALTGNMATGKSTVCQLFANLGIDIISADAIAQKIRSQDPFVTHQIREHFGQAVFDAENQLDRRKLRQIIFSSEAEKTWLENLLHPRIRKAITHELMQTKSAYAIIEIPLHFQREDYPYINKVILISADTDSQIQRIMARDHCTRDEALAAIHKQPSFHRRAEIADYIIENNGLSSDLETEVQKLHTIFLNLAKNQ